MPRPCFRPLVAAFTAAALAGPAVAQPTAGAITVQADAAPPRAFAAADLRDLPRAAATLAAHGEVHRYTGVPLAALLARAGAWPAGDAGAGTAGARGGLRGPALARYVLVTGADGYRALLALAELDTATAAPAGAGAVIVADSVDGRPLPAAEGPWRLVVPADRRPARSVRQVVAVAVRAAP